MTSFEKRNMIDSKGSLIPHISEPTIRFSEPAKKISRASTYTQSSIRYALTGIVVHIGNAHGGHYVSYRRMVDDNPITSKESYESIMSQKGPLETSKWAYISDSSWKTVPESVLAKAKPYMLFYERVN